MWENVQVYTPIKTHICTQKSSSNQANANPHSANSRRNPSKHTTLSTKKNMIYNLSDHTTTQGEFSVLVKDFSFVPNPINGFNQEIKKFWNKFKTRMLRLYFFCSNIYGKPPAFKRKSIGIPTLSHNHTLVDFLTHIEQEHTSINTPYQKTHSNLSLKEKEALNNLKNYQSIFIKSCHKVGGICIMNTRDSLTKIHIHLQDRNTYKPLTQNPVSAIACFFIAYKHSQHIIHKATIEILLPLKNTCIALFCRLPKIHSPTVLSIILLLSVMSI